ncbi:hypothetical protein Nepgr_001825 [Nepenthes gracilis]|uniref:Protein kinase domain-containing protein n=1 Tax=Nepenthes gracilis TaxID=150966 RepID=A0AAD3P5Q2_NEPGR|nr:hypothetical protein Nepgr_001825 [Nepenthes gracilis]
MQHRTISPPSASPAKLSRQAANETANETALNRPMEDVKTVFVCKELGRRQFGVTHLVIDKQSSKQIACKMIAKHKHLNKEDIEDARREVQNMQPTGQPNIVQLNGAYEDRHSVH